MGQREPGTKKKPGAKPGVPAGRKRCPNCQTEVANAKRDCPACGVNLRKLKADRVAAQMEALKEAGGPGSSTTYYMNKIYRLVCKSLIDYAPVNVTPQGGGGQPRGI